MLGDLLRLRAGFAAKSVPVRVFLVARVREPLSYYLSFYKWKIAGLQRQHPGNANTGRRAPYGRNFTQWAPHNLQASGLLFGDIDAFAGPIFDPRRRRAQQFGSKQMERLTEHLRAFDVVAPIEYFDEHLLLISDSLGLPKLAYKVTSPMQIGIPRDQKLSDADVCPDVALCRQHIARIAPWDHKLYEQVRSAFRMRIRGMPRAFHVRLALFRSANRQHASAPGKVNKPGKNDCCARVTKCLEKKEWKWLEQPPACVPGWSKLKELVISDRGGTCCTTPPARHSARARGRRFRRRLSFT